MRRHLTPQTEGIAAEAARFAGENIAPLDLGREKEFPFAVWRRLGEEGLLGLLLPREAGGRGLGYTALLAAGEALAREGGNLGIVLSFMIHNVVSRFVVADRADGALRGAYLPALARGERTVSLAISEPGVGAHPKHLTTTARRHDGLFLLTGEKSYLTNGPFADLYAVLAVTSQEGARKNFSLFLVPRDAAGLSLTPGEVIDFLRPSPHCGIRLEGCPVPAGLLVGPEGRAYEEVAVPFRDVEDVALMGPLLGAMYHATSLVTAGLRARGAGIDDETAQELGRLVYLLDTLQVLAREAATVLDGGGAGDGLVSLTLAFRALARRRQMQLERLAQKEGLGETEAFTTAATDIRRTLGVASAVLRLKQTRLGRGLMT